MVSPFRRFGHILMMSIMAFVCVLYWLPFVRCLFDGESYRWANSLFGYGFSGTGVGGDFPFLLMQLILALVLAWSGWRHAQVIFRPLALIVSGLLFADAIYMASLTKGSYFEGGTLGVGVDITLVALFCYGILFALVLWYAVRPPAISFQRLGRLNWSIVFLALMLFPVQYMLLSSGRGQEASDQIGVLITIGQWFLINLGLALPSSLIGRRSTSLA